MGMGPHMRISATLSILIVGGSALQQTREAASRLTKEEQICGTERTPYELINAQNPNSCTVFCVPAGECQSRAQTGKLNDLGITAEGTCMDKGYTEPAPPGNSTLESSAWLKVLQGPCQGMVLLKFKRPTSANPPGSGGPNPIRDESNCGKEKSPYEAINERFPKVCSVYCVPKGQCESQLQDGKYSYLGIIGKGNCKDKGYTESAKLGNLSQRTLEFNYIQGPCKGMTISSFEKPEHNEVGHGHNDAGHGHNDAGHGHNDAGHGHNDAGHGHNEVGHGHNEVGHGHNDAGHGHNDAGHGHNDAGHGHNDGGHGHNEDGHGHSDKNKNICEHKQEPYQTFPLRYPGVCLVLCTPAGECEKKTQMDRYKRFGIIGKGDCVSKGYTRSVALERATLKMATWFKNFSGPCKGMKLYKFLKPESN